jgi:hypothetical protein
MKRLMIIRALVLRSGVSFAVLCLLYFLSVGPVLMLADRGFSQNRQEREKAVNRAIRVYGPNLQPWIAFSSHSPGLKRLTQAYVNLWRRITGIRNPWQSDLYQET